MLFEHLVVHHRIPAIPCACINVGQEVSFNHSLELQIVRSYRCVIFAVWFNKSAWGKQLIFAFIS